MWTKDQPVRLEQNGTTQESVGYAAQEDFCEFTNDRKTHTLGGYKPSSSALIHATHANGTVFPFVRRCEIAIDVGPILTEGEIQSFTACRRRHFDEQVESHANTTT